MSTQPSLVASGTRHAGPNPGFVAVVFTVLQLAAAAPILFAADPVPRLSDSAATTAAYLQANHTNVLLAAFFMLGSAFPLGIFTATIVSRLRFLGIAAAGVYIALFGGLFAALDTGVCGAILWTMSHPGIALDAMLARALYYSGFMFAGVGYAAPVAVLMAGVSVVSLFAKLMPKWISVLGLVLAVIGVVSWFGMLVPQLIFLYPITRFGAFVWLIAGGFRLPSSVARISLRAAA